MARAAAGATVSPAPQAPTTPPLTGGKDRFTNSQPAADAENGVGVFRFDGNNASSNGAAGGAGTTESASARGEGVGEEEEEEEEEEEKLLEAESVSVDIAQHTEGLLRAPVEDAMSGTGAEAAAAALWRNRGGEARCVTNTTSHEKPIHGEAVQVDISSTPLCVCGSACVASAS